MKLVMDERIKHRIIGLAVILSLIAIFMPAMIKKSNQRLDSMRLAVKLPPKPDLPTVIIPEKEAMFKAVKVARVDLPAIPMKPLAKASLDIKKMSPSAAKQKIAYEAVEQASSLPPILFVKPHASLVNIPMKAVVSSGLTKKRPKHAIKHEKPKRVSTQAKLSGYAVQLATFLNEKNAKALMSTLHTKGYAAVCHKVVTKQGSPAYRVIVGKSNKQQAHYLRQQLASSVKLEGFVVSTGIG